MKGGDKLNTVEEAVLTVTRSNRKCRCLSKKPY